MLLWCSEGVLASSGCRDRTPDWWPEQQRCIFLQLWRLEVWDKEDTWLVEAAFALCPRHGHFSVDSQEEREPLVPASSAYRDTGPVRLGSHPYYLVASYSPFSRLSPRSRIRGEGSNVWIWGDVIQSIIEGLHLGSKWWDYFGFK